MAFCGDRGCTTGQAISAADNTARKVTSHFFGRNKNSTRAIDFRVWHHLCRMTYQRSRYAAEKLGRRALCQYYIDHLNQQFVRLRLWRPEATFTIQLWEPAKKRLNEFHALISRGSSEDAAKRLVAVTPGASKKPKPLNEAEAVDMAHAEHIDEHLAGEKKPISFIVDTVLPWVQQEVQSGAMVQMPPIEFLLNEAARGETIIDPDTNYARWVAFTDGRKYQEPTISEQTIAAEARKPIEDDDPLSQPPSPATGARLKKQNLNSKDKGKGRASIITPPEHKTPVLKRLSPPRPPVKLDLSLARFRLASSSSNQATSSMATNSPSSSKTSTSTSTPNSSTSPTPKQPSPADDLPLYVPPSPAILRTLKKKDLKRKFSIDIVLANEYVQRPAADQDPDSTDTVPTSRLTLVTGTPIMARGMVFAGGKPKLVPRKRAIDEVDEDDDEGEEKETQSDDEVIRPPPLKKRKAMTA